MGSMESAEIFGCMGRAGAGFGRAGVKLTDSGAYGQRLQDAVVQGGRGHTRDRGHTRLQPTKAGRLISRRGRHFDCHL